MATVTAKNAPRDKVVWGWLRLFLGFAQMSLAALTFGILITAGVTEITVALAGSASSLALISRLIYRGRKGPASIRR